MALQARILAMLCVLVFANTSGSSVMKVHRKAVGHSGKSYHTKRQSGTIPEFEGTGILEYKWFGNFTVGKNRERFSHNRYCVQLCFL